MTPASLLAAAVVFGTSLIGTTTAGIIAQRQGGTTCNQCTGYITTDGHTYLDTASGSQGLFWTTTDANSAGVFQWDDCGSGDTIDVVCTVST